MGAKKRWGIVFGPEGAETGYVVHPGGRGMGWTYSKKEAQQMCPPGGRVIDADAFLRSRRLQDRSQT
jgi:hypothetical protein